MVRRALAPYEQDEFHLNVDGDPIATFSVEGLEGALALGRNLGDWGEARVAYSRVDAVGQPRVATPGLFPDEVELQTGAVTTSLLIDTLDSSRFPRIRLLTDAAWRVTDESHGSDLSTSTL